jgi:hypothetical protein
MCMKKVMCMACFVVIVTACKAQTWAEWFQQKKTQIKYLAEQIAANKVYLEYLQKGYRIAKKGLTTISDIKNGEFHLHQDFFNSFKHVNPKVRSYAKVAETVQLQIQIVAQYKKSLHAIRTTTLLNGEEKGYCERVLIQLLESSADNIQEVITLISDGELQLQDDERIARIDKIYKDMQDKYSFSRQFGSDINLLKLQHFREENDIETSHALHGIK